MAAGVGSRRLLRCRAAAGGFGQKKKPSSSSSSSSSAGTACPCGGGARRLAYAKCCKRYHTGERRAGDPETLLRARFSAYAKGKAQYIIDTTHEENELLKEGGRVAETGRVVSSLARDIAASIEKVPTAPRGAGLPADETPGEEPDAH